jgi:muramoyltetrapeptide carboxypeptidase
MNRKHFLSSILPLGAVVTGFAQTGTRMLPAPLLTDALAGCRVPPYLKKGDIIGITCPAGSITAKEIQPAVDKLTEWGFVVKTGATVGAKDFTFGGTDAERKDDFQALLDDPSVKAILCARGGYGTVRIIDQLSFKKFSQKPKWVIGFSDVTVLHSHIHQNLGIASLHSKMCNSFPEDWNAAEPIQRETIESIRQCLTGEKMRYNAPANANNRLGKASGMLVGGNLSILENLAGTKSDLRCEGKLLFLEEVEEYLYSVDRMLWNLKRSGKLAKLAGLVVGGFSRLKVEKPGEEFGRTVVEIVQEKVKEYAYPVCYDFPVGHQRNNFALKCGVRHHLVVDADGARLSDQRM